jgi:hypothetical protein
MHLWQALLLDYLAHLVTQSAQTLQRGFELRNSGRSSLPTEGRQTYLPLIYTEPPGQQQGNMQEVFEKLLLPLRTALHNVLGEGPFTLARQHTVAAHIA